MHMDDEHDEHHGLDEASLKEHEEVTKVKARQAGGGWGVTGTRRSLLRRLFLILYYCLLGHSSGVAVMKSDAKPGGEEGGQKMKKMKKKKKGCTMKHGENLAALFLDEPTVFPPRI